MRLCRRRGASGIPETISTTAPSAARTGSRLDGRQFGEHPPAEVELLRLRVLAALSLKRQEQEIVQIASQEPRSLRILRCFGDRFQSVGAELAESTIEPLVDEAFVET